MATRPTDTEGTEDTMTTITHPSGRKLNVHRVYCETLRAGAHVIVGGRVCKVLEHRPGGKFGGGVLKLKRPGWPWKGYDDNETILRVTRPVEG